VNQIDNIVIAVLAGLTLSAAAGFRAFLPLAVVSWAAHLEWISVGETFHWMSSQTAVIVFTTAVLVETIGDKFPAVDHALDALGAFIKPVAATVLTAVSLSEFDPVYGIVLGIVAGGGVAAGLHLLKAKARLVGNLLTFGLAAPVLSLLEDAAAIVLILLAFFLPLAGLLFVAAVAWFLARKKPEPVTAPLA
jgi:uncharacterized membrane protein